VLNCDIIGLSDTDQDDIFWHSAGTSCYSVLAQRTYKTTGLAQRKVHNL